MRVFQRDQTGEGLMFIVRVDRAFEIAEPQGAIRLHRHRMRKYATQLGHTALLEAEDMRAVTDDSGLASLAVGQQRAQVSLGAARDEDRRFLTQHVGGIRLQLIDSRIVVIDIIADLRFSHRLAHFRRGMGNGVASQVNIIHGIRGVLT